MKSASLSLFRRAHVQSMNTTEGACFEIASVHYTEVGGIRNHDAETSSNIEPYKVQI